MHLARHDITVQQALEVVLVGEIQSGVKAENEHAANLIAGAPVVHLGNAG